MEDKVCLNANRRDFIKGAFWTGAAAALAGCAGMRAGRCCGAGTGSPMHGFAAPAMPQAT